MGGPNSKDDTVSTRATLGMPNNVSTNVPGPLLSTSSLESKVVLSGEIEHFSDTMTKVYHLSML